MGKFKDFFSRDKGIQEPAAKPATGSVGVLDVSLPYEEPKIKDGAFVDAVNPDPFAPVDLDGTDDLDYDDDEPIPYVMGDEPDPEPEVDDRPSWQRKGRPYVHFRTVAVVEREGGFKFTVHGRSGKRRFKSELYTEKSNAKRAAKKAVKKTGIPAKFVDDQYSGQVIYDTNAQDA